MQLITSFNEKNSISNNQIKYQLYFSIDIEIILAIQNILTKQNMILI